MTKKGRNVLFEDSLVIDNATLELDDERTAPQRFEEEFDMLRLDEEEMYAF